MLVANNNLSFKGAKSVLKGTAKIADLFIQSQENLSSTRFIQDTLTNWAPKAIFARSKADFAETSFLEFLESGIFYFASPLLGEKLFRNKIFKKFIPENLKEAVNQQIPKSIEEILKNKNISKEIKNRTITTKAGILLACTAIPAAEYTLSFAKNLFTLKTFKKSNFNSIANLNKTEKEDKVQQQKTEDNAKKYLKRGAAISLAGVAAGAALAIFGGKSEKLVKLSKGILEPGTALSNGINKLGIHSEKVENCLKKVSLDFANDNEKLALSKGQLALTAILGLFGYSKAAQDRGKLDVCEVWTRVPLVVFYTIFGSELFDKGFEKIIDKKEWFPDLIKKGAKIPKREELPKLACDISKSRKTSFDSELKRLTKEKALISAVPYAFSLLFMGFSLSAITRLWTQFRYNKIEKQNKLNECHDKFVSCLQETPFWNEQYKKIFKSYKKAG